jgi:hypothetical protein
MEDFYGFNEKGSDGQPTREAADKMKVYQTLLGMKDKSCICDGQVFPSAPCDVFRAPDPLRTRKIERKWHEASRSFYAFFTAANPDTIANSRAASSTSRKSTFDKTNHLTPKGAGGCPDNPGNLQPHDTLCAACKLIDDQFGRWQGNDSSWRTKWDQAFRASGIKRRRVAGFTPAWW